ncbi:hypothetical protein BDAP_001282 [Binucleata daphniae]
MCLVCTKGHQQNESLFFINDTKIEKYTKLKIWKEVSMSCKEYNNLYIINKLIDEVELVKFKYDKIFVDSKNNASVASANSMEVDKQINDNLAELATMLNEVTGTYMQNIDNFFDSIYTKIDNYIKKVKDKLCIMIV